MQKKTLKLKNSKVVFFHKTRKKKYLEKSRKFTRKSNDFLQKSWYFKCPAESVLKISKTAKNIFQLADEKPLQEQSYKV